MDHFPEGCVFQQIGNELHIYLPGNPVPRKFRIAQDGKAETVPIAEAPAGPPPITTDPAGAGTP